VIEAPKLSDIQNVFGMHEPQHMLSKLLWEIDTLITSTSVWTKSEGFPVPIFAAFNTAVTAWHITDWLWHSHADTRSLLAKRFKISFNEGTPSGLRAGLKRFQEAVAVDSRPLYICREIANGSKHMRNTTIDPNVKAIAQWNPVIEGVGLVKPGDLVLSLTISNGADQRDAARWFIDAFGYWEQLFTNEKLVTSKATLPDTIIRAAVAAA